MANVTVSEIAGFGVGALLLIAASAAPKVDSFVARSQRRFSKSASLSLSLFLSVSVSLICLSTPCEISFQARVLGAILNLSGLQGEIVAIACASCF